MHNKIQETRIGYFIIVEGGKDVSVGEIQIGKGRRWEAEDTWEDTLV